MKPTPQQILNRFSHHPPDEERAKKHARVTELSVGMAMELVDICNDDRQLSLALTALEEVRMRANASIAGGG